MYAIKYAGRDLFLMSTAPLPAFTEKRDEALTFATKDAAERAHLRLPGICGVMCNVVVQPAERAQEESGDG